MKFKLLATAACMTTAMLVGGHAAAQEKLTVWWAKGYYKAEDDALFAAIKKFEAKTKVKVELSQYAPQEAIPKSVAAMDAKNPPDVAYADVYDFQVAGKWAFDGKLEDVSSIIDPMRAKFEPAALATTFLYNSATQGRAYYAYPIKQQTMHIQYWKDMLAEAGFKDSDIPKDWAGYWDFWCSKVQVGYRQKTGNRGFGIGKPMGVDSTDSFFSFLTFMDAHNVKLVSDSGKLLVDDPADGLEFAAIHLAVLMSPDHPDQHPVAEGHLAATARRWQVHASGRQVVEQLAQGCRDGNLEDQSGSGRGHQGLSGADKGRIVARPACVAKTSWYDSRSNLPGASR